MLMKKIIYWSIIASLVLSVAPTTIFASEVDENDDLLITQISASTEDSDNSDEVVIEVEDDENVACTDNVISNEAYFEFNDSWDDLFVIKLTDSNLIQEARNIINNVQTDATHVNGIIIKEPADYNPAWSFHYNPSTIVFFENAMEVCDSSIAYIEEHLDEVGGAFLPDNRWCPWGSKLTRELKLCSDGTFVERVGSDCGFAECPDVDVDKCLTSELITCDPDKTMHMVLYVRWGDVLDTPSTTNETIFDGSISLAGDKGHVSLIRKVLFEPHASDRDKILTTKDPVSWQSATYGHWDGVSVLVSAKASQTITIQTDQGSISRTAESFFEAGAKIIEDVGNGKEIVVKALPYKKRPLLIQFLWGGGRIGNTINFTGSAVINDGAYGKRYKTVRFEPEYGDKITSVSKTSVYWNSYIAGGYDGILAHLIAEKDIDNEDSITFSFDNLSWSQDFSILELYHNRVTKVEIPVVKSDSTCQGSTLDNSTTKCPIQRPYVLRIAIVRLPNNKIVKVPGKPTVYKIEDDTAKPILSAGVFEANGFAWTDLEEISQDELDTYAEGDNLNYPDGTLIKGSGPAVFVVSNGQKRPLVSASAFLGLGYKWGNIKKIRDPEVSEYDTGDPVEEDSSFPDGSLVRLDGTAGVYRIEGGKKKPIRSSDVFVSNGYHWGEILVVPQKNKNRLNQYEPGSDVTYPDGTLIKGSTPSVYVIDKGVKRPINSADDFAGSGYSWGKIKAVDDSTVNSYETGDEVIGGDA